MEKTKWILDEAHSELLFKVKHLMLTTVTGQFRSFSVTAETEGADFTRPYQVTLVAQIDSLDTNNEQRDMHLKSEDFFHAKVHTQLFFKSGKYEGDEKGGRLYGELTIRGHTKEVVLNVEHGGLATDPYGRVKAGFTASGKISRKEFGLIWNTITEAGGVIVGDEIKLFAEIQLIKQ
jgi:polyisoprenoid-binding protein YceI